MELTSGITPGATRPDTLTPPGIGRDGKAVTAGIAPSGTERFFNFADQLIQLQRDRLNRKDSDPTQLKGTVSVTTRRPKTQDVATAGTQAGAPQVETPGFLGLTRGNMITIAGAVIVTIAIFWVVKKR